MALKTSLQRDPTSKVMTLFRETFIYTQNFLLQKAFSKVFFFKLRTNIKLNMIFQRSFTAFIRVKLECTYSFS